MRRLDKLTVGLRILSACLPLLVLLLPSVVLAQFGAPSAPQQATTANQLPLSGRVSENGAVTSVQTPVPGTTTSVNTINPTVQAVGPYAGSVPSTVMMPFSGKLSFADAIQRGLRYNLGEVGLTQAVHQVHGQRRVVRSVLLPNIGGSLSETVQQVDLEAAGLRIRTPIPGFSIPAIVGPFNFFDLRARLTQSVVDLTAMNNYRSITATQRAAELSLRDARDLVILGVGGSYLQVIAAKARIASARAQLDTAEALYKQALDQRKVGVVAQVDVDRSEVQVLVQRQRLLSLENELGREKINLARMTGLPPNDRYDISDDIPFSASPALTVEEAVQRALQQRSDLKAAVAQVEAAQRALAAARSERLPSLTLNGDYGVIGTNPAQSHGTFSVSGTLHVPLWPGGRTAGDIEQAEAALSQRLAELADQKDQIEGEVRKAFLDLDAASSQVAVSQRNIEVSKETLELTRQRFDAGVSDNVEVVQAQEALASANLDYVNSVFAHNVAKLSLARALGASYENLPRFLKMP